MFSASTLCWRTHRGKILKQTDSANFPNWSIESEKPVKGNCCQWRCRWCRSRSRRRRHCVLSCALLRLLSFGQQTVGNFMWLCLGNFLGAHSLRVIWPGSRQLCGMFAEVGGMVRDCYQGCHVRAALLSTCYVPVGLFGPSGRSFCGFYEWIIYGTSEIIIGY